VEYIGMDRGFMSQKGSGVGRGVKEKLVLMADKSVEVGKHGAKKDWGLSPEAMVRVLHTAQLDVTVSDIQKKDKIEAKTDKTKHGMEKRKKSKSTKSKSTKVKVKDGAETEDILNGPTRTHLIGRCMGTCSSSNLVGGSSPNLTYSNPKRRNRKRSKQPFILEESLVDTMADQRTMAEVLRAPTEGYAEEIMVPPILAEYFKLKHSFINMMTSNQFSGLEKVNPHDYIPNKCCDYRYEYYSKTISSNPPPAFVKVVEEICVTYDGVANQIRPPGFTQSNVQNNQNRFSQPQGYNRGNNFNQDSSYQAQMHQNQVVPLSELEKIKKMNKINIKSMQTQINNVNNELRNEMKTSIQASMSNQTNELKNMMASFFQMNTASTSGLGPLPSNTIANAKGELKAITTRSGLVLDGPSVPMPPPFIYLEEDERVDEILTQPKLALLFDKEKLLELANTPLNENCSAFILKKLPEKLGDPGKFLIPCLPELISTRMTLELTNRAICTPTGIERNVFVLVGKFTFLANFVIVDYKSDPRVPLILGRPFLRTAHALIDVHGEEMILHYGDERLTLNIRYDTSSYSNQPQKESINMINIYDDSCEDYLEEFTTSSSSSNHLLKEFADELALITFPPRNDDLSFDIKSDLGEIEYMLNHDPTKEMDSILKDSVDEDNLAEPNDNLFDTIPEMFTDEQALDYSSPPLYDDFDDDLDEFESDNDDAYNDPFYFKGEKIKESKLLIDELDLLRSCDFLPYPKYDSFLFEDFSKVDALPLTNNDETVFNLEILIHKNRFEVTTHVAPDKNVRR
nr:hypothetical protein [Tanacetum cinerariifolium]